MIQNAPPASNPELSPVRKRNRRFSRFRPAARAGPRPQFLSNLADFKAIQPCLTLFNREYFFGFRAYAATMARISKFILRPLGRV
jgi:hypothetical protein